MTEAVPIQHDATRIGSRTDTAVQARQHVYFDAEFTSSIGAQRMERDRVITVWKASACEKTEPGAVRLKLHATGNNPYRLWLHH